MRRARRAPGVFVVLALVSPAAVWAEDRSIDGSGNNVANPTWGSANVQLLRQAAPAYSDAISAPAGSGRPSARAISNGVAAQTSSILNDRKASDFVWQWGQFVDHDIDLTGTHDPIASPGEVADISTPVGDPFFLGTPIGFVRSLFVAGTSVPGIPRQQPNLITAYIDGSNVYGSDAVRAAALRTGNKGLLATSQGNLLPFNTLGLGNAQPGGADPADFFLAGDVRANEQAGLTATHTLFMREHNRLAKEIRKGNPQATDEEIYQEARRTVGAELQVITYKEFLPVLLGAGALSPYTGYSPLVDAGISNEFSTAAYRFGHSMLSATLLRLNRRNREISEGHLALRDAFFNPSRITDEGGIDPLLRGLADQIQQEVDPFLVDDVRNFLFGPPGAGGGVDLASLNAQRGRDHGLLDYNSVRVALGLAPKVSFADISSDVDVQSRLQLAYGTIDKIDPWVGGLSEDHVPGAIVGEMVFTVLKDQFERLRDGDRFYYENVFSPEEIAELEADSLGTIIRRNTKIKNELDRNVFLSGRGRR